MFHAGPEGLQALLLALSGYLVPRGGASITPGQRLAFVGVGVCYFRIHQGFYGSNEAQKYTRHAPLRVAAEARVRLLGIRPALSV